MYIIIIIPRRRVEMVSPKELVFPILHAGGSGDGAGYEK